MSANPFAAPAPPGDGIKWDDLNGSLLLIEPKGVQAGIQTVYGTADAVQADVVVLDGPKTGETYVDTLVFPKVMQGQLKAQIGAKVLGRLGQGQAKTGQSPPWLLSEATPQDQQIGRTWLTQNGPSQPQVPQQPQQGGNVPF